MNKCQDIKCNKLISNYYLCETCPNIYCSSICLNNHAKNCGNKNLILQNKETHSKIISNNSIPDKSSKNKIINSKKFSNNNKLLNQSLTTNSVFYKKGFISTDIKDDNEYLFDNFEVVRKHGKKIVIGEGAFAEVFLVKHKKTNQHYALKQMDKDKLLSGGISTEMIYREILIQKKLNHDNIIKLFSSKEDDKNIYLILEYAIGGSLYSKIKRNKKGFDEDTAFKYFIQSTSAIAFLHQHKLVHRDVKPENFLIDSNGIVRLCDFGWCRDFEEGDRSTFCGTYEYMAPEILKDQPYSYGIDVWALGILLYELTHGYSPFRATTQEGHDEIMRNIVKYKFKIEKNLSPTLEDLILKLLTPNHNERLNVFQIFSHPWVLHYEKMYFDMKNKKEQEKINNTTKSNSKLINEKTNVNNNTNNNNIKNSAEITNNNSPNQNSASQKNIKMQKALLNDFSIFSDSFMEAQEKLNNLNKNNKIKVSTVVNDKVLEDKSKNILNNVKASNNIDNKKDNINTHEYDTENLFVKQQNEDDTKKHSIKYFDLNDASFLDITGIDNKLNLNNNYNNNNLNLKDFKFDNISILQTPNEDNNQSLFDDVLNQVFLKNTNKKRKPSNLINKNDTIKSHKSSLNNKSISTNNLYVDNNKNINTNNDNNNFKESKTLQSRNKDKDLISSTKENIKQINELLESTNKLIKNNTISSNNNLDIVSKSKSSVNNLSDLNNSYLLNNKNCNIKKKYNNSSNKKSDNYSAKYGNYSLSTASRLDKDIYEEYIKDEYNYNVDNNLNKVSKDAINNQQSINKNLFDNKYKENDIDIKFDNNGNLLTTTKEKLRYQFENETNYLIKNADLINNNYYKQLGIEEEMVNNDYNNKYESKNKRETCIKNVNKELDLDFLDKDLLYNDKTYELSNSELLQAIDILEGAQRNNERKTAMVKPSKNYSSKEKGGFFANLFSAFRCGN